ncbi:rhomboid family intramembrane serine protease [Halorubrum sp. CBA1229]|uniref:rhomboid family intramembrane serine protease n=1 Tax=Halorubrum sp. CBA1229 TaxID=1853699 RepID=UPI0011CD8AC6|nr:rhomboid family intramembrane serine protease [Halorubrum sp. CBA1229]QKY18309.1 rhomboid family intramembrane serine protease [Halorubrum sp. CBA1229]
MYVVDRLRKARYLPTVTIAFVMVFLSTYTIQLLLVGSLSQNAGYQAVTMVTNALGAGSIVFSWLFHSSHTHLLGNLTIFVLTGWWVESQIGRDQFILGVAVFFGMGASVAALILFQTPGAGISGITTGLVTMVALGNLEGVIKPDHHLIRSAIVFTLSAFYLLRSVSVIGTLPAGTAVKIHILGAVFGAVWYTAEKSQHDFSWVVS